MERRASGVLLLLLALIAAIALPVLAGKPVAGAPLSEVIAGPPAVGSCVGDIGYPDDRTVDRAADRTAVRPLPVATVVPCSGEVSGEIISVTAGRSTPAIGSPGEGDQAEPSCRSQVEKYLGATPTTVIGGVEWNLNIDVDVTTVGPNVHDRAAGRTWSACVLSATNQIYPATPLHLSWQTGTLPDAFGLCWAENLVQHGVPTNCTSPHRTQQLGYGFFSAVSGTSSSGTAVPAPELPTPDQILAGCRKLAASVMKVADPTRGGALAVKVVDDASGAPYVQCAVAVAGTGRLTGSLIGIGNQPLPLT